MTGGGSKQRRFAIIAGSSTASPLLFEACVNGKHIKEGVFVVQQGKSVVVRWVFEDMLATAFGSGPRTPQMVWSTASRCWRRLRYTTTDTRGWEFLSKTPW